jgi:hypothetical protein
MDFSKLSRPDAVVLLGGVALVIGLLAFPWYHYSQFGITLDRTAIAAPGAVWGILGMLVAIAVVVDLVLARYVDDFTVPSLPGGRERTRAALCALMIVLLAIKFFDDVASFGWGFYVDAVLAAAVTAAAWRGAARR